MIPPFARVPPGQHGSKRGLVSLFRVIGTVTLLLWFIGDMERPMDLSRDPGVLVLGLIFFSIAWLIGRS